MQQHLSGKEQRAVTSPALANKQITEAQRAGQRLALAMANPNWRDRSTDCSSSSSASKGVAAAGECPKRKPCGPTAHSCESSCMLEPDNINNRKISKIDRMFNIRPAIGTTETGERGAVVATARGTDHGPDSEKPCEVVRLVKLDYASDDGPDSGKPCRVIRLVKLDDASDDEEGLFLLQVRSGEDGNAAESAFSHAALASDRARIQRIEWTTTVIVKRSSQPLGDQRRSGDGYPSLAENDASNSASHGSKSSTVTSSSLESATGSGDCGREHASLQAKNAAFQRLLDKLRRPPSTASQAQGSSEDSGYSSKAGFVAVSYRVPKPPQSGGVVRGEHTASDFIVSYREQSESARHIGRFSESTRPDAAGTMSNSLNPKAREFLSFGLAKTKLSDEEAQAALDVRDMMESAFLQAQLMRIGGRSLDSTPSPMPLHSADCGYAPGPLGGGGGAYAAAAPQLMAGWYPGSDIFGRPNAVPTGYQAPGHGCHTMPARLHPCAPMMVGPGAVPVPVPGPFGAGPPIPVPKPLMPNTQGQQAYEEYIERRKAMEPGYAIECRLRQQRRAKRGAAAAGPGLRQGP